LQGAITGRVVLPGSSDYDSLRKPSIPRFHDVRPQAVVRCETPTDVAETIRLARRTGLRAAARSGGHCFAGHSSTEGVVIDVTPMRSVSVSGGTATVGAGARLGAVYDSLDEHDLTIAAGCGPTVGIAGLTLGGGLGILGRKHGLTADNLLAAQVVLADGRVVDCDDHHTRSCSGRCAAPAAATSAWSPRWCSAPSRHPRRPASTWSGRTPTRRRWWTPGRAGRPTRPTSSPPASY